MQNGGATLSLLPTTGAKASAQQLPRCGSRLAIAIQDSQFQRDEAAAATAAQQSPSQALLNMRYAIGKPGRRFASVAGDLKFASAACPATEARRDRAQKKGRTIQNCIAR